MYWDEWYNEPPACDPCGRYGNCRKSHLRELWGKIVGGHCSDDGCLNECGVADCDGACGDHVMAHDYRERDDRDHEHAPTRAKKAPVDPAPAPPVVPSDDDQPDQKAQRTRRVIRR